MVAVVAATNREWVAGGQSAAPDIAEATHVRDGRRFTRDCSRCMLHDFVGSGSGWRVQRAGLAIAGRASPSTHGRRVSIYFFGARFIPFLRGFRALSSTWTPSLASARLGPRSTF